jgi:hypothetical protein
MQKVANRDLRDFGWEIAHAAVSRRPPIYLDTIVLRTEGFTYAAEVWDLSIIQGPFSVAPGQTLTLRFATCVVAAGDRERGAGRRGVGKPRGGVFVAGT